MPLNNLLRFVGSGALLLAVSLSIWQLSRLRRSRLSIATRAQRRQLSKTIFSLYKFFLATPLLGRYLNSIKEKIALSSAADDNQLIYQSMKVMLTALGLTGVALLFFAALIRSWYSWLIALIVLYFVIEIISDYHYGRIKLALLEEMVVFIDYLRTTYFETAMIDDAFISAIDRLDAVRQSSIYAHANQIYDTLIAADADVALQRYYQQAPNAYLKLLAGLSHIVREYGDSKLASGSSFIKSLTHLSNELKDDIIKRKRLLFGLKAMNIIAVVPIFAIEPLKRWASHSFYPLKVFYEGSLGFSLEIALLVIVLLCFTLLRRIQDYSEFGERQQSRDKLERYLAMRFRDQLKWILPAPNSKWQRRFEQRQQRALVYDKLEYHYIRKFLAAALCFIVALAVLATALQISRQNVFRQATTPSGFLAGELKGHALEQAERLTDFDNGVLAAGKQRWSEVALADYLAERHGLAGAERQQAVARIIAKQNRLAAARLNFMHIIGLYLSAWLGWLLPDIYLLIQAKLLKAELDSEIARFQLLIMVLMQIDHLTVDQILEWFEKFSKLFKVPLQRALLDYDAGAVSALTELKRANDKADYQTLINHLIVAVQSLTIKEAFHEFESEKLYYQDKRKLIGHNLVKSKIYIGRVIGFLPLYALLILYFMFPLIYASVNEMQTYFDKLTM